MQRQVDTDDAASLKRCTVTVAGWLAAISFAPPGGLFWQSGAAAASSQWLTTNLLVPLGLCGFFQ